MLLVQNGRRGVTWTLRGLDFGGPPKWKQALSEVASAWGHNHQGDFKQPCLQDPSVDTAGGASTKGMWFGGKVDEREEGRCGIASNKPIVS